MRTSFLCSCANLRFRSRSAQPSRPRPRPPMRSTATRRCGSAPGTRADCSYATCSPRDRPASTFVGLSRAGASRVDKALMPGRERGVVVSGGRRARWRRCPERASRRHPARRRPTPHGCPGVACGFLEDRCRATSSHPQISGEAPAADNGREARTTGSARSAPQRTEPPGSTASRDPWAH